MPASSRAHLLLPSPQGLLHYDLLEDTAFLGAGGKRGLIATPMPFQAAKLVLSDDGGGFVVRALPGEAPPDVNGVESEGARVRDGDRIRLGDQVALFRTNGVLPPPPLATAPPLSAESADAAAPAAARSTAPRSRKAPARPAVPSGARSGARVLGVLAAMLFLFAVYQAVQFLQTPPAPVPAAVTAAMTTPVTVSLPREEQAAEDDLARIEQQDRDHASEENLPAIVALYTGLARSAPGTPAGQRAAAHVSEAWPRLADFQWKSVSLDTDGAVRAGKYRRAVDGLQQFDARFGGTEKGALGRARLEAVRASARASLDGLRQRIAPLMATDPSRAYRILTMSGLELPPDLEAELGALMSRVRDLWGTPPPPKEEGAPPPKEGPPGPDAGGRPTPGNPPGKPTPGFRPPPTLPGEEPAAPTPGTDADAAARTVWEKARTDLLAKHWADAKKGYGTLLKEWKDTSLVSSHLDRVRAGRQAADFGLRGAAALLTGNATVKNERLEVEYTFEEDKALPPDFAIDQPFPGDEVASAEARSGMAILSGSTSMLLKVVFDPLDVSCEMDAVADEPRDFGLVAFQEGHDYRACAMHVGNTQFRLKKGSAATVLSGHVLWMFGDGVWRDADPGERGFIRLAVKNGNGLKPEENVTVRLELKSGQAAGEIHAKGENVELKGALKGDDGKGMGPLRVGAFAYKGRVGIRRLAISGKVDAAWATKQLDALLDLETGPDGK